MKRPSRRRKSKQGSFGAQIPRLSRRVRKSWIPLEAARRIEAEKVVPLCSVLDSVSIGDRGGRPVFRLHVGETEPIEFEAGRMMSSIKGSLSRPEKEHDRGSRPRPSPGPPSGCPRCDADGGVAPVGEALVAAGALRRDPRWDDLPPGIGEIARVRGTWLLSGAASCWRGFLLRTGGTGASSGTEASRPGGAAVTVQDPWRAATPHRPLRLARPSLRGREPTPGGCELHGPSASLPFTGENKRGLPLHRRDPVPGDCAHGPLRGREPVPGGCELHGPLRLSPHRGEQEGSSPSQERPCSQRLGVKRASLPFTGENKRGLAAREVCDSPIG